MSSTSASVRKKTKRKPSLYLYPLKTKRKKRVIATYDIESKEGKSPYKPGMTRPFLACLYDGKKATLFRDTVRFEDKSPMAKNAWRWEHLRPVHGCIDKLCRALFHERRNGTSYYAHNGGTFDHLFILPWLTAHRHLGFDFTVIPVQSTIIQVLVTRRVRGKTLKWTLLDSMRLLPMGLARAAKTFALPGKTDLPLETHEDDPRWEEYNARDCMALYEIMEKVTDLVENKLHGEVGITAPASSMNLFRRHYQEDKILRHAHFDDCPAQGDDELCDGCCHDWIRTSYVGGRTEIFEMMGGQCLGCGGEEDAEGNILVPHCPRCLGSGVDPEHFLRYYDRNSAYVAALCEPMPVGERIVEEGKIDWAWRERGYVGFAACQVEIPGDCPVPPLPKKDKDTKKLVFPTGKLDGVWDIDELALLFHPRVNGKITWVGRVVWFKGEPVFKQMMMELWALRDKNRADFDEGLSALAKLFGNGLYGKFAMALLREEIVFRKDEQAPGTCILCGELHDLETEETRPKRKDGSVPLLCEACTGSKVAGGDPDSDVWYRAKKVRPAYVIPQISAHTTSLARIGLWKCNVMAIERGGRLFMNDSVTGDRTVVAKSPRGDVTLVPIEKLWNMAEGNVLVRQEKEERYFAGWRALARDVHGKSGWFPLRKIVRHEVAKPTWRITTKHGQTEVTTDHGIMVDGKAVSPSVFVREKMKFTKLEAPRERPFKKLDLFEYVKDFRLEYERGPKFRDRRGVSRFLVDEKDPNFIRLTSSAKKQINGRVRRYYKRSSPELRALLGLIGSYTSDGSASLRGVTTQTRTMLSFCKSDLKTMKRIHRQLKLIFKGVDFFGPHWAGQTYVLNQGGSLGACFFAALCGFKSRHKRFPPFVFKTDDADYESLYQAMVDGDGSIIQSTKQFSYTSTSNELTSGVSYLLSQHGKPHLIAYRDDRKAWSILTRKTKERNRCKIRQRITRPKRGRYVYDLSVEGAHTFVDGIGRVLLHNTDSVITNVELPCSNELGDLKDEYPGEPLSFLGVQPKVYLLQKAKPFSGEHLPSCDKNKRCDCKSKSCTKCHGCARSKVTFKGVPKSHRNKQNLRFMVLGGEVVYERLEKIRSMAGRAFAGPPKMMEVKRRIVGRYEKRVVFVDGRTRALEYPMHIDPAEQAMLEAALAEEEKEAS